MKNHYNSFCGSYIIADEVLYEKTKYSREVLIVPNELIKIILAYFHCNDLLMHLSEKRLYDLLVKRFYWKGMYRDISYWVAACLNCRKHKDNQPLQNGLLLPIIATSPFEVVGIDIVGPLNVSSNGNRYILVCATDPEPPVENIEINKLHESVRQLQLSLDSTDMECSIFASELYTAQEEFAALKTRCDTFKRSTEQSVAAPVHTCSICCSQYSDDTQ